MIVVAGAGTGEAAPDVAKLVAPPVPPEFVVASSVENAVFEATPLAAEDVINTSVVVEGVDAISTPSELKVSLVKTCVIL